MRYRLINVKTQHFGLAENPNPQWRRYALDHVESLMWKSSHSSGESPQPLLELEKSEPGYCHDSAWLPMSMSGGGTPSDPGGHTALAQVDPMFMPLSLHHPVRSRDTKDDPRFILPSLNPPSKPRMTQAPGRTVPQ